MDLKLIIILLCSLFSITFARIDHCLYRDKNGTHVKAWCLHRDESSNEISGRSSGSRSSCGKSTLTSSQVNSIDEAELGELPWQVCLQSKTEFDIKVCDGTLINHQWIVTAAHCGNAQNDPTAKRRVILGRKGLNQPAPQEKSIAVSRVIIHPKSGNGEDISFNDIALVKMASSVSFSEHIQPICLPTLNQNFDNLECINSGWGLFKEPKPRPDLLMRARITVFTNAKCMLLYKMRDSLICAGNTEQQLRPGNTGGPLQCRINGRFVLAGILSVNGRNANRYIRVSHYLDWIRDHAEK